MYFVNREIKCYSKFILFIAVKETTKTASYLGVILAGVGVTGFIFYQVFKELFSSKSPNSVYSASLTKCCADPRVVDALGQPIKGFGEETRRGRRRHVRFVCLCKASLTKRLLLCIKIPNLLTFHHHYPSKCNTLWPVMMSMMNFQSISSLDGPRISSCKASSKAWLLVFYVDPCLYLYFIITFSIYFIVLKSLFALLNLHRFSKNLSVRNFHKSNYVWNYGMAPFGVLSHRLVISKHVYSNIGPV